MLHVLYRMIFSIGLPFEYFRRPTYRRMVIQHAAQNRTPAPSGMVHRNIAKAGSRAVVCVFEFARDLVELIHDLVH